jgi:glutamate 5-kinase
MRIVVKIGSSSLTNNKHFIDEVKLTDHVDAIAALAQAGHEVIIVSSGAVAAGFKKLGYPARPITIKGKQAAAAVGQSLLIQQYSTLFAKHDLAVAQLLLTRLDFTHKKRYQNAYQALNELLERSVVPIINENDTVSVTELTFGDNDMLSALVAGLLHADTLVILTDINGLYTANPAKNPDAIQLNNVEEITQEMIENAKGTGSSVGTGGMETKLYAASYAMDNGINVFIGTGHGPTKLLDIVQGNGDGTYFLKKEISIPNTKRWISLTESAGKIVIDQGAYDALINRGKSLLLAGVTNFEGQFEAGEVVEVYFDNRCIGRGEVTYSSIALHDKIGKNKTELGIYMPVLIHRDSWVKI